MKLLHADDPDHIGTGTLDVGSHAVEEVGHIHHVRFTRAVFDDRASLCHGRRHHNVDGRANGYGIQIDMASPQMLRHRTDRAVADGHLCTERLEALQVQIDRPAADIAAAREGNLGLLVLSKQCAKKIVGCTNLLDGFIADAHTGQTVARDQHLMTGDSLHLHADLCHRLQHDINISHVGKVRDQDCIVRHNRCRQDSERSILGSADLYLTDQRIASPYDILFHKSPL